MKREVRADQITSAWGRQALGVSVLAGMSKVAGLARDVLVAALLGASGTADGLFLAFQVPNLFRRMFGDGVWNGALVPALVRAGEADAARRNGMVTGWLLRGGTAALAVSLLLVWLPEVPARMLASSRVHEVAALLRLMAAYVVCISISVILKAYFEQMRMFTLPALMPLLFNLVVISVTWTWWRTGSEVPSGFAVGVVLGGLLQAVVLVLAAVRAEWRPAVRFPLSHRGIPLFRRMLPLVMASGMFQLNLLVSRRIASGLAPGSVAVLDYGYRLVEVTLGVVAFPLATVLLPSLSRYSAAGDRDGSAGLLTRGLSVLLLVAVPASVGLVMLRQPIVAFLFQRGSFGREALAMTSGVLGWLAAGLVAFGATRLLMQEPFSRQSVGLPVAVTVTAFVVNALAAGMLSHAMGVAGVGAAASLAAGIAALMLLVGVARRCSLHWARIGGVLVRVLAATGAMAWVVNRLRPAGHGIAVLAVIGAAILVYAGVLWMLSGSRTRQWILALWREQE